LRSWQYIKGLPPRLSAIFSVLLAVEC